LKYDIGFLGGGQLARMSIQAAQRMGLRCLSLDPGTDTPASQIADNIVASLDDVASIARVFRDCNHVTLENEFIPIHAVNGAILESRREVAVMIPSPGCLGVVQDKLSQRQMYARLGAPTPQALAVELDIRLDGLRSVESLGFPMVLKARRGSYDGKGTIYAKTPEEFEQHRPLWIHGGWMAEEFVSFKRELAVMVCRSKTQTVTFPTMETVQTDHVCDLVFPANVDASEIAIQAVEAVEGYGLFGVELFELQDGSFKVNEIAPRPHNTGHYSLDWGGISQFEAHVRLVMGLPIPEPKGQEACMANLLGQPGAGDYKEGLRAAIEGDSGVHVHWYGKAESRPGRKMGHINAVGPGCVERAKAARDRFYRAWTQADPAV
jgi:5-(carboxyamino)imidazole ribonucleotide synthase